MENFDQKINTAKSPEEEIKKITLEIIDRVTDGVVRRFLEREKNKTGRGVSLNDMIITVDMVMEEAFNSGDKLKNDPDIRRKVDFYLENIKEHGLDGAKKTKIILKKEKGEGKKFVPTKEMIKGARSLAFKDPQEND